MFLDFLLKITFATNITRIALEQGWANYGPLRGSVQPAEGLENAKKKKMFRKTFENHVSCLLPHICAN
jgi:hypothetical protein